MRRLRVHLPFLQSTKYLIYFYKTRWNNTHYVCIFCKPNSLKAGAKFCLSTWIKEQIITLLNCLGLIYQSELVWSHNLTIMRFWGKTQNHNSLVKKHLFPMQNMKDEQDGQQKQVSLYDHNGMWKILTDPLWKANPPLIHHLPHTKRHNTHLANLGNLAAITTK